MIGSLMGFVYLLVSRYLSTDFSLIRKSRGQIGKFKHSCGARYEGGILIGQRKCSITVFPPTRHKMHLSEKKNSNRDTKNTADLKAAIPPQHTSHTTNTESLWTLESLATADSFAAGEGKCSVEWVRHQSDGISVRRRPILMTTVP